FTLNAQIFYSFKDSTGTYTPITGTYITFKQLSNGTGVASDAWDDGYVNAVALPFTFTYNGTAYTKINVCTNGFISLGKAFATNTSTTAPTYYSGGDLTGSLAEDTAQRPIIAPFWGDLIYAAAKSTPTRGVSYATTGTTPNRIFTVQWHNAGWDAGATAGSISFQLKIFETSNVIQFIYNRETGSIISSGTSANKASIGLTAAGHGLGTFISVSDSTNSATISKVSEYDVLGRPNTGQYYIFTPVTPLVNDAGVTKAYTTAVVATAADPQSVSATVTNAGTGTVSNVAVTLNVTGANTFTDVQTIPSLASGKSAYVTFATFTPTTLGTNNISVSIPSDNDNSNNSASATQLVTKGTVNYMTSNTPTGGFGQASVSDFTAKFSNPNAHNVNNILLNFASVANGPQPFTVGLWDATGTDVNSATGAPGGIIWTSPTLTTAAGPMSIPVSPSQPITGDFFVVVSQTDTIPFELGYEEESPVRLGTFYVQNSTLGGFLDIGQSTIAHLKLDIGVQFDSATTTPVSLVKFSGSRVNNTTNLLKWSTTTETNNAGFEILRSADGVKFNKIALVQTKANNGNSNTALDYNYADVEAPKGTNYYRLNQLDKNGKSALSEIVVIKEKAAFKVASIYPNPVQESMTLSINSPATLKGKALITDMTGKSVLNNSFSIFAGDNLVKFNVSNLKAGNYTITVTANDGSTQTQMFEKK
ncbi:MAG: T9SS type A sorting domain-containing protein, partial [Bacteroidota bacterium]